MFAHTIPFYPTPARVKEQAAIVRALTDHLERCGRAEDTEGVSEQLAEEVARLGRLEAAASTARLPLPDEGSPHVRPSASAAASPAGFVAK